MRCFVLTGSDEWALRARRAQILTELGVLASDVERFDLAEDGGASLVQAASTFAIFGGTRVLDADPADQLGVEQACALVAHATDVTVVLRGPVAVPAAVRKALGEVAEFEAFKTPTGRAIPARVDQLATENGIQLSPGARDLLVERGGHDLPRVRGLLAQLAMVNLTQPSLAQVERLLGSSAAPGVPWALSDAIEAGDIAAALEVATSLEPVAVVAYLSSRTGQLGRVVDDNLSDPDAIASAFGMSSRFPAQKLGRLAARLGKRGVAASWDAVAAADRSVKVSADPRAALDLLVVRLAALWSDGQAPVARESLGGPQR